jgi:hypothetical protein
MNEVGAGIKRAFWNDEEQRLRALFRVPVVLALVLLTAQLVVALVGALTAVVALPGPLTTALVLGLVSAAVLGIAWFVDRRTLRDIGFGVDRSWWLDLLAGLGVGLAMAVAVVGALLAAGVATPGPSQPAQPDLVLGGGSAATTLLYGLAFFAGVALLEEVLVRGYLLVNTAEGIRGVVGDDRRAVQIAIAVTAGLFGALHAANPGGTVVGLVNISLAGLLLGWAYAVTDRLAFPVGLHLTWNFGLGPLFGLPVSGLRTDAALVPVRVDGPALVTGGAFGPEGGAVMLVALAVAAAAFAGWARYRYGTLAVDGSIAVPDLWTTDGEGESASADA